MKLTPYEGPVSSGERGQIELQPYDGEVVTPDRSWGEVATDTGATLAAGVNSIGTHLVELGRQVGTGTAAMLPLPAQIAMRGLSMTKPGQAVVDAYQSAQDGTQQFFTDNAETWKDQRSDKLKSLSVQRETTDGTLGKVAHTLSNPTLLVDDVLYSAPEMGAIMLTGGAAGQATAARIAARGITGAAARDAAIKAGVQTNVALSGAAGGASAAAQAREEVQKASDADLLNNPKFVKLIEQTGSVEAARAKMADDAAGTAFAWAAPTSAAAALLGARFETSAAMGALERRGATAVAANVGKEAGEEYLQEGLSEQLGQNIGAKSSGFDDKRDLLQGVNEAGVMGAVTGGVLGAGAHAYGVARGRSKAAEPDSTPKAGAAQGESADVSQEPAAAGQPAAPSELAPQGRQGAGPDAARGAFDAGLLDDDAAGLSEPVAAVDAGRSGTAVAAGSVGPQQQAAVTPASWPEFLRQKGVSPAIKKADPAYEGLRAEYKALKESPVGQIEDAARADAAGEDMGLNAARDQIAQTGEVSAVQMAQDLDITPEDARARIEQITGKPAAEVIGQPAQAALADDGQIAIAPAATDRLSQMEAQLDQIEQAVKTKAQPVATPSANQGAVPAAPVKGKAGFPAARELLGFLNQNGGIALARKPDLDQNNRRPGLFRQGGADFDMIAEKLIEHGYMAPAGASGDVTVDDARNAEELIGRAIAGETILPLGVAQEREARAHEHAIRQDLVTKAEAVGINTRNKSIEQIGAAIEAHEKLTDDELAAKVKQAAAAYKASKTAQNRKVWQNLTDDLAKRKALATAAKREASEARRLAALAKEQAGLDAAVMQLVEEFSADAQVVKAAMERAELISKEADAAKRKAGYDALAGAALAVAENRRADVARMDKIIEESFDGTLAGDPDPFGIDAEEAGRHDAGAAREGDAAGSGHAGDQGDQGFSLATQDAAELTAKAARENDQALADKQTADAQAGGFTLDAQSGGFAPTMQQGADLFGGPSVADLQNSQERARQQAGQSAGADLFAQPATTEKSSDVRPQSNDRQMTEASSGKASGEAVAETKAADQEKLAQDYRNFRETVMGEIMRRGDLPKLMKGTGKRAISGFNALSLDDQASAYAEYVAKGAEPVAVPEDYNAWVRQQYDEAEQRRKDADTPGAVLAERQRIAEGRPTYTEAQTQALRELGITGETADGDIDATEAQWVEIDKRTDAILRGEVPFDRAAQENTPARAETTAKQPETARAEQESGAETKAPAAKIEDVGEKIGGARKDTATKGGTRGMRAGAADETPTWRKRYVVMQDLRDMTIPDDQRPWVIFDKRKEKAVRSGYVRAEFKSEAEAEAALPGIEVARNHRVVATDGGFKIYRDVSDRKRVQVVGQTFGTRDEAMQYMVENAETVIETKTSFGEEILPRPEKVLRSGAPRRDGDVTGHDLKETFGFRGVEFGNWNNQDERQEVMNHAYDALADLAEVLNIQARAIGLNGELALAFGARGHGLSGARAHYELDYGAINLTKMKGAGSLAHEWFHSLDHFFGRQDGKTPATRSPNDRGDMVFGAKDAESAFASHGFKYAGSGVREELREAYSALIKTMFRKAEKFVEDTQRAEKFVGAAKTDLAQELQSLRDYLAKDLDPRYYKRNNKAASAEQLAAFDTIAEAMIAGESLTTEWRYNSQIGKTRAKASGGRWTNDAMEQLGEIYRAVRGRSGFNAEKTGALDKLRSYMARYSERLKMLADAQASTEKTKSVPTDFAMDAKAIDQGRASDYWTTEHEMAARAFQAYVEDKLAEKDSKSFFLTYGTNKLVETPWGWVRPYPAGEERAAINAAFDKFIGAIQTKETEQGVTMAMRTRAMNTGPTRAAPNRSLKMGDGGRLVKVPRVTSEDARAAIAPLLQSARNLPPVQMLKSPEQLRKGDEIDQAAYGWMRERNGLDNMPALMSNGRIYIFTDNLTHLDQAREAILHEGFHYGLRGLMDKNTLDALMLQIRENNPAIADLVENFMQDVPGASISEATEEVLAEWSQANEMAKLKGFGKIAAVVRKWLRSLGFVRQWSDNDIRLLLQEAQAYWQDKPLSEQPEKVREAFQSLGLPGSASAWGDVTGQNIYFRLALEADSSKAASEALAAAGIRGIKYLDGGSRADGDGSYNYVIFDDAAVQIEARAMRNYTPEQQAFRQKAGIGARPTIRQKIERMFRDFRDSISWDAFRQGALDQFHGIRLAEARTVGMLPVEQSAYVTARLATGSSSVMAGLLGHGQAKWAANGQHLEKIDGSKGLLDILKPVEGQLDDWLGWMVANRAARLMKEGRENNFTADDIKAGLSLANGREAEFKAVAKEFAAFKRSVLDIAEQAGLIDPAGRRLWDHADWIPFYRQMQDDTTKAPGGKRGLSKQSSGIRQLKGGESAMNDPLENILMNFQHLIDASLKNNALRKVIANIEQGPDADAFLESVGYGMQGVVIPRAQVEKQLLAAGVDPLQIAAMPPEAFEGLAKMWALHAPEGKDIIRVMEGGKPHFYRVTDPLLLKAVTSFEPFNMPGLPLARAFKRLLTRSVTATPAFMMRNFIRDSASTAMISRDRTAVLGAMRGILKSYKEEGGFEHVLFAGASFAGGQADGADPEATAKAMRRELRGKGFSTASADEFMASVIDTPLKAWDAYSKIGEAVENANREAVFEAAKKAGKSDTAAAFEALDLMDFRLRGSSALYQLFADVVPFVNARVQGLYRLGRSDLKQAAKRSALMLLLPSVLLALANAGEDDYEALPDWDKDTYWHFFIGGHHFRMPKPFEVGVLFGTLPERITRAMMGNDSPKKLAERAWFNVADQFNLVQWPQIVKPAIEVWKNEDGFSKRPIENQSDEGKLPSMRYSYYTSDTMKALAGMAPGAADATGLSPKKLEHLFNGYLGSVGSTVLAASDLAVRRFQGLPYREAMRLDEYPMLGVIYRENPAKNSQYVEDIYKMAADASALKRSMDAARKEGNIARADEIKAEHGEKIQQEARLRNAAKSMTQAGKQIERVRKSEDLTPDEKREQIDQILERRNLRAADIAKQGIKAWGGSI